MKNTLITLLLLMAGGTVIFISGCAKENEEDLLLDQQLCRVDTVSFSQHIQPFINVHCMPCHDADHAEGGFVLTDWATINTLAVAGVLMGVMKHEPGFKPMPDNAPKVNDCAIAGFEKWIAQGAQDN